MNKSILILLITTILITGCAKKEAQFSSDALERGEAFVSQIGGTSLGRLENIAIDFTQDIKGSVEDAITLSPAQKGSWSVSERRAVFTPSKPYGAEKQITLIADCKKLFSLEEDAIYVHKYLTDSVRYDVKFDSFVLGDGENEFTLTGTFTTDIPAAKKDLQKSLKAKFGFFNNLKISWEEMPRDPPLASNFKIGGIVQGKNFKTLNVLWNGRSLGATKKQDKTYSGKKEFKIPAKNEFAIFDINESDKNKVALSFSKALDTSQNIRAFVKLFGGEKKLDGYSVNVNKNVLTVYSEDGFLDATQLVIENGIKSVDGAILAMGETIAMNEVWEKPQVQFASSGVIIPTSQGTVVPVRTKNLSGLLIQAFAIHDWNMTQFLQNNTLDDTESMYRVGEPVWEKNVSFEWKPEMKNKFIATGIDISELLKKYPDGMMQLRISFRKHNTKYVCRANHPDFSDLPQPEDKIGNYKWRGENNYWNELNNMPYEKRRTYWQYEDDPCHPAYYMASYRSESLIEKNILISDIGLMAKKDTDGNIFVTAADLKTAKPLSGAEIALVNYVGRKIASTKTNSDGSAVFKNPDGDPYYVLAKNAKQNSYLQLSGGTELSISHFETGGEQAVNGVKGFIYGERGVWRPGDELFLTFVLQDLNNTIPKDFPATFELQDPTGRIAESRIIKENVNGFYPIKTSTNQDAPTGFWIARVKMGGREWSRSLKIETVLPNKLSVKLDAATEMLGAGANNFTLKGAWLHGAPTPNYKAEVSVRYTRTETAFEGYSEYSFTNPRASFESSNDKVWEGNLESDSAARFNLNLGTGENGQSLPGKLKANFTSRLYEPSGAFSTETKSFVYSPYQRYCGIKTPKGDATRGMLLTDTEHTADVVLLDASGNPVESAELDYAVYKLEWKWWWEKDAYADATYVSYESSSLVNSGKFNIKNGKGNFKFRVDHPAWGRYLILAKDGNKHCAGNIVYIDWPNWAGRAQESGSGSASMLTLMTDKKNYNVGEAAQISFSSGSGARALVTIEKSGMVVKQEWIETKADTTSYKLPLTDAMAPNVYVHVTLVQPHNQTANSLPIRLYGIVPVKVENPATILTPVITTAEKFEPHKNCAVSVSEKNGKEMTYTLAVVDEGLLGLTNFRAPDLHSEFYKKEASMLTNYDLYKYVMNAYSGKLETLLAIGGGEDAINNTALDANRFTPVVKFFGPYTLKAGEKKATEFEMPGYIGAVRAIVIAGSKGAYGSAEKSVKVKSDLMVQPSIPRTLGLDETIEVPVTVFNGTEKQQNISVAIKASGAAISGQNEKTVSVKAGDNAIVPFTVKTNIEGVSDFVVTAKMPGAQTVATVPVTVESRGVPIAMRQTFIVKAGENFDASIVSNVQSGTAKNTVELSTLPQMNMSERLKHLITYPHGCIEQITSGAFPQLYLPGFLKLDAKETENIKTNVNSVLTRHKNYRTSSGALAYWPGDNTPNAWGSCYAAHFELEAKKAGYDVDENLLNPLLDWIASSAASWNVYASDSYDNGTAVQAYRLFVLALAQKADIASMNRLSDGVAGTDNTAARLMLSCAYSLAGQNGAALRLLKGIEFAKNKFRHTGGSLNSSVRERAMYLFACNNTGNTAGADNIAKEVADTLCADEWLSTQEISWSLIALLPWYKSQGTDKASYTIAAEGQTINGTLDGGIVVENIPSSSGNTQKATVANNGKKTLYGTFATQGISIPGTEKATSENLSLEVKYLDQNKRAVNVENLKVGDSFKINVSVRNASKANVRNIALTMPIPTCWEISNERLTSDYEDYSSARAPYTYQDIRDDNVFTYFDLRENETKQFTFSATVVYSGEYFIPAVYAEAMYDNEFSARKAGIKASAE